MQRSFTVIGVVLICGVGFFSAGCTTGKEIRYTPGEIESFSPEVQNRIRAGELSMNMTQAQVRLSWGAPHSVRTLPGDGGGVREVWEYRSLMGAVKTHLYFEDGVLTRLITGKPAMEFPGTFSGKGNPEGDKLKEGAAGDAK